MSSRMRLHFLASLFVAVALLVGTEQAQAQCRSGGQQQGRSPGQSMLQTGLQRQTPSLTTMQQQVPTLTTMQQQQLLTTVQQQQMISTLRTRTQQQQLML